MAKIVLISSKDYNFYNFRRRLILQLQQIGHDVLLVCPKGEKMSFFTEHGCRFTPLDMDRRGTSFINDLKLLYGYYRIFKKEKPDVVLTYTGKSSVYGGCVCRLLRLPCIVNNAGLLDTRYYSKLVSVILGVLYRVGFKKAACMMYQNTYERDYLNKVLKNSVHYRDIPGSGVDLDEFVYNDYPDEKDTIIFNYVGRIVSIKGIKEYLDCAEQIHEKYLFTKFRIFGEYDDRQFEPRIKQLEEKGAVEYCGSKRNMVPYICESSAAIHVSYYEGMTNVILEHGAIGRPSIVSNIPGCKEGVDNGVTGYIVALQDSKSLIDAVEKFILLTHDQRKKMGQSARAKMEREFDRNIVTNIYLEEINRILN